MSKDKRIVQLEDKTINNSNNKAKSTSRTRPISYKILNIKGYEIYLRIELLWNNSSGVEVAYIEGTLKIYDKNNNLLGFDNVIICRGIKAYSESAYVVRCPREVVPNGSSRVDISISDICYR